MLWGFNKTDAGLSLMLLALVVTPLLSLVWLNVETVISIKKFKTQKLTTTIQWPLLAALFLVETLATELFILSHLRM
jgi:hypothetical protein